MFSDVEKRNNLMLKRLTPSGNTDCRLLSGTENNWKWRKWCAAL